MNERALPGAPSAASARAVWLGFAAVILLAALLRAWDLGGKSLWVDEVFDAWLVQGDLSAAAEYAWDNNTPPLHFWLNFPGWRLAPDEAGLRLASALAGVLGVAVFYLLARHRLTPAGALAGMFLFAVNREHLHHSQDARMYALFVLFTLLATGALLALAGTLRRGEPPRRLILPAAGFGLATVLNLYNHYFGFMVFAGHLAWAGIFVLWLPGGANPRRVRLTGLAWLAGATAVVLLAYLPWFPALLDLAGEQVEGSGEPGLARFGRVARDAAVVWSGSDWQLPPGWRMASVTFFVLTLVAGLAAALRRAMQLAVMALLLAAPPTFFLLAVQTEHFFALRYLIFLLPFAILLQAFAVEEAWRRLRSPRGRALAACLTLALITGLAIPGLARYYTTEKQDWRGLAAYLTAAAGPNDAVVTGINASHAALAWYMEREGWETTYNPANLLYRYDQDTRRLWAVGGMRRPEELDPLLGGDNVLWYAGSFTTDPRARPLLDWFTEKGQRVRTFPALTPAGEIHLYRADNPRPSSPAP